MVVAFAYKHIFFMKNRKGAGIGFQIFLSLHYTSCYIPFTHTANPHGMIYSDLGGGDSRSYIKNNCISDRYRNNVSMRTSTFSDLRSHDGLALGGPYQVIESY